MEPSSNSPSLEHRNVQFSDSFRFFILKTPATFTNVSPFLIEKAITGAIGEVKSIRKHEGPKVCDVRRITIRRDGQVLNTKHLILTFSTPDLPQTVKMAYIRCPVRPYIPNPLRCFQCQRYGHSKNVCRGQPTCPRCGESGHDSADCKKKEQCLNCKGEHPAYSRSCPTWITEKEITAVKIKENISYPEARRVVLARTPVSGKSYASATRKSTSDKCIQCDSKKDISSDSSTPTEPEVIAPSKNNSPPRTKVIAKPISKSPPPVKKINSKDRERFAEKTKEPKGSSKGS
ncbi:CCHC-type domain-containing protein [Trichonephila clavipes]|nr:CCHC-type domain-containing protein [Trichonephila clavipes]